MDNNLGRLIPKLISSAVFGKQLTLDEKSLFSKENAKLLLEVSKKHDVIHLVSKALIENGLIAKDHPLFLICQKAQVMAVYRYEQLNFELQSVSDVFEKAEIQFLPLKGSVLRAFYPEPWMRTSCDIDVLVHPSDVEKAIGLLQDVCGYSEVARTACDIAFATKSGCHVELHFDLLAERFANGAHKTLENVWEHATVKENCKYWHILDDDMFYFYHIVHMSKHFEDGGCGIRPFLDLYILDNLENVDFVKRDNLLKKANMFKFAEGVRLLSRVWFANEQHTDLTLKMEGYLLYGGAFGTMTNRVALQQHKKGGKKGYALSRLFPDRKFMSVHFKYVEKHPWLMPVAYVHRAFTILFRGNAANSLKELKASGSVSEESSDNAKQMLEQLGLL